MRSRAGLAVLVLLTLGTAVNLLVGVRRVFEERRLLSSLPASPAAGVTIGQYTRAADDAAAAVRAVLPPGAALTLVVYGGDMLGELDCAIWADYRFKWLLYPRRFGVYRQNDSGELSPDPRYPQHTAEVRHDYLLLFRVTAPPRVPSARSQVVGKGPMWALVRTGGR